MPNRMTDTEVLGQTAEWLSRVVDTIERVTERLADSISKLQAEQSELRDKVDALAESHATLQSAYVDHQRTMHDYRSR